MGTMIPDQTVLQRLPSYSRRLTSSDTSTLCRNSEGWGPISSFRYDLTPCFLDVWIVLVSAWGILGGSLAIWFLLRGRTPEPTKKNWHFVSKFIVLGLLILGTIVQASFQIASLGTSFAVDIRFWASIATLVSIALIAVVQYQEHWRSRQPNGVVLFYWLFLVLAYSVKLRSLISRQLWRTNLPYFVVFTICLALSVLEFALEYLVSKKQSAWRAVGEKDECPMEFADVFSVLTFSWMTPMMKYGYQNFLNQEDLWNLRERDTTEATGNALQEAWNRQLRKKRPSLWLALFQGFGGPYYRGAMIKFLSDILSFLQPQLLRLIISFVDSYRDGNEPQPAIRGAAIALAMFAASVCQTVTLHQYFQRSFETGMRVKSSLTAMIYTKSLKLSSEGRAAKSTGDIVNYMAIDQQRLADLTQYGLQLLSAPFQIVLCMISLYQLVGLPMLAGVGAMVLTVPLNALIAKMMKKLQITQMKNKDQRTRLMTEILNNMKSIKLYAWTSPFMDHLSHVRNDLELNTLRKIGAAQSVANFTWSTTPFLVSCSTFAVFVLASDRPLSSQIVFPALTLFNLLTFPLSVLPMVITSIIEATVAAGRIGSYLSASELQEDAVRYESAVIETGEEAVRIRDATFTWDRTRENSVLLDINFKALKGDLTCVIGRVGAGKSSLLQSILGDLFKIQGEVIVRGRIAYVAQQPWIMNASVKENILFGHRWDEQFYHQTVEACALMDDFSTLPDGDSTEVGERGISLSGGQKARLALARAVYARTDIYLLDDVLSAVDQHVGRHLINKVLGPDGLLKAKTRILATNAIPVLGDAGFIYLLRDRHVLEKGTIDQLRAMKGEVFNLIKAATSEEEGSNSPYAESALSVETDESLTVIDENAEDELERPDADLEDAEETFGNFETMRTESRTHRHSSFSTLRRASTASFHGPRGKILDHEGAGGRAKQSKEVMEQGKVKWDVYGEYAKASNLYAVGIYLVALVAAQSTSVGGSFWLKEWSEVNERAGGNPHVGKFIGVYFAFGIGSSAVVVIQTLILWIFCSIEVGTKIASLVAFLIASMYVILVVSGLDIPVMFHAWGFSVDIYRVDEVLARTFNMLFVNASRAAFTLAVIAAATPVFLVLIVPLGAVYLSYQKYYLRTSRELKRLDSVSRSPIYAHFQESLDGVSTIRAYRQQTRFTLENEWRMDANLRAYFPSISANRWLAVRLEFIGSVIILGAASFAIVSVTSRSGLSTGLVGLSLSYALQITQSLNWIVRQTVEVETNIVSVERILEYARLPSEAPDVVFKHRPNIGWPAQGAVQFKNYSTRYRAGLDLVLKDITLDIEAHQKVGVVGRTGAGKSSLTLALFRIIEPATGSIIIDDLDISSIGLLDLRRRLAIIPQDAALFQGTIRDNLDPRHVHDDTELWSVLEHARLKEQIASMPDQLEAIVHEGGSNLSHGQRQLVSLARALLTPSNILVLDEATAAVDVETDSLLQSTLRSRIFQDRTIITIAHRINTILDSDKIIVLQQGQVAEFDTPSALIRRKGHFYGLVQEAGLLDGNGNLR